MLARFDCLLLAPHVDVVVSKVIEVNALFASDLLKSTTRLLGRVLYKLIINDAALILI